jgi:hypothetical protein
MTATFTQSAGRAWNYTIAEPMRAAIRMLPQTLITSGSVYLIAGFGGSHGILPAPVAWAMAVGFEWTLLRGWATAARLRGATPWEVWGLNGTAAITVIAYGILYIIGLPAVGIIPDPPGAAWGLGLAIAKVIPLALMTFFAMMLHRAGEVQKVAHEDEWERRRKEIELADLEARKKDERDVERLKMRHKAASELGVNRPSSGAPAAASRRDLDARLTQLVDALRADTSLTANKAEWARRIGVSRTAIYPLIKEAQARGLLPRD